MSLALSLIVCVNFLRDGEEARQRVKESWKGLDRDLHSLEREEKKLVSGALVFLLCRVYMLCGIGVCVCVCMRACVRVCVCKCVCMLDCVRACCHCRRQR